MSTLGGYVQIDGALSSSEYTGDWIDADGASTVRVAYGFEPGGSATSITVQQSPDQTNLVGPAQTVGTTGSGQADIALAAQFFRLHITGGTTSDAAFHVALKEV